MTTAMAEYKVSEVIEKLCCNCHKVGKRKTKPCPECKIARYCGDECKSQAFPKHRSRCKAIQKQRLQVAKQENNLRAKWRSSGETWKGWVGYFWSSVEARNYCRAYFQYGIKLTELAQKFDNFTEDPESYLILMEVGKEYLELLRLNHTDNQGVRHSYVFVLLALDRVQDAYDFVHWWETLDPDGKYTWDPPEIKKGEWIYPRRNILENLLENEHVNKSSFDVHFLLALIVIKIHIIGALKDDQKSVKEFDESSESSTEECIEAQGKILLQYCAALDKRNQFVLQGVIDPEPLLAPGLPQASTVESIERARIVVHTARMVCEKKFDVQQKVQEILQSGSLARERMSQVMAELSRPL